MGEQKDLFSFNVAYNELESDWNEKVPFPHLIDEMVQYSANLVKEKVPAYLAIDPGKFGGLTVMCEGKLVFKSPMPLTAGDNLDLKALYDLITGLTSDYLLTVLIEDVHSIFGSSAGSNFTFGYVCGAIEAVVVCCRLKYIKVQPKTWQKEVWTNPDKCYKPKRPDQKNASVDTKPTSLNCARRLFPDFDFRSVEDSYYADSSQNRKLGRVGQVVMTKNQIPNDGIIDSALMCEYARIKNL